MSQVLVDTNVVLAWITNRDVEQQRSAERFFGKATRGQFGIALHQQVVSESVYVLTRLYRTPRPDVAECVFDIAHATGTEIIDSVPWPELFEVWPSTYVDFADAILAVVARTRGIQVATFDRRFARRLGDLAYPLDS